ncbi:MAG: hypothetical protein AMJ43_07745 [Coxiella sp. DG_40]|nr:MAG: hypothetical protein AMJ43_07745 [Coxiella sp. DG_40]
MQVNTKISDLTEATEKQNDDLIVIVDTSDTTMASSGTNKKASISLLNTETVQAAKTSDYLITTSDNGSIIELDGTSSTIDVTSYSASGNAGKTITLVAINADNAITIKMNLNGLGDYIMTLNESLSIYSNGTNWRIM